jgi:two-component system, OmpR family, sensor histidine kinase VicK
MSSNVMGAPIKDPKKLFISHYFYYVSCLFIGTRYLTLDRSQKEEEKTELLYGVEAAVARGVQFMKNVKVGMDLFGEKNGPSIIMEYDVYRNNYIDVIKRRGKIRLITEITKENLHYCKELRKIVTEMRHLEGLVGGISVSESEYMSTTTLKEKELLTQVFYSNAKEVVRQGQYIFDTFWHKAIPAEDRIREIEEGIKPDFIETIRDPTRVQNIAFDLVKSCKEEILTIFSTSNAFLRQERAGGLALLNETAIGGKKSVRILVPYDARVKEVVKVLETSSNNGSGTWKANIRFLEPDLQTKISLLIVDRESSLAVELKDDTNDSIQQAIGLSSYSNSKSTVLSYVSMFETLWKQTEMYEQLKIHDKMQKEFINIAAHELRTPIQPILGLAEIVGSKVKEDKQLSQLLDVINRNAKRLQRLTEDILDVTRIESNILKLHRTIFDLNDTIINLIADYEREEQRTKSRRKIRLSFSDHMDKSVIIEGDKGRITQVVSNLLSNAIKFTHKGGEISLNIERDTQQVIVSVKDNGQGIDPEMYARLFTKFATNSSVGTGLGLYISKSIVEAHGGKMWAENNRNGRGATFSFVLPMINSTLI